MDSVTISGVEVAKFAGILEWEIDASGISREALADEVGFHVSALSQIKKNPDLFKIAKVFKRLGVLEERARAGATAR